jgi:hypothetical protein
LVFGKTVEIKPTDMDRYGRTIAWVCVGSKCVSKELLKAGLAWYYKRYPGNAIQQSLKTRPGERRSACGAIRTGCRRENGGENKLKSWNGSLIAHGKGA